MFVRRTESGWVVQAPAKINLALEVLGRRTDGYHEVETLLAPVRLFDTVGFRPTAETLTFSLTGPALSHHAVPADHRNLAFAAVERLAEASGRRATGHLSLCKRIPSQAGLGGGSSDAAAALVAANLAWDLGYSLPQLCSIAAELGSDVPFFLHGGAAVGSGRGDQIESTRLPTGLPLVIAQPPAQLSTPAVYAALDLPVGQGKGESTGRCRRLVKAYQEGAAARNWEPLVRNCLQAAAIRRTEWMERIADAMRRLPVIAHQMTGSGSGYFGLCRTWREARGVAARLREGPWPWVVATRTCL